MATNDALAAGRFPDTRWSLVLAGDRGIALEHLAAAYWRPIYGYVRAAGARDDADALDATQSFFVRLVESDLLDRAQPGRGRFRAYIRTALSNFLADEVRRKSARNQGGAHRFVPLDDAVALHLPDSAGKSPDAVLDELWRAEVLERAAHELERELAAEGKAKWWSVFRDQVLSDEGLSHSELAQRYDATLVDVANWLTRTRARYRAALIRVVRETVAEESSLAQELGWLLGEQPS